MEELHRVICAAIVLAVQQASCIRREAQHKCKALINRKNVAILEVLCTDRLALPRKNLKEK